MSQEDVNPYANSFKKIAEKADLAGKSAQEFKIPNESSQFENPYKSVENTVEKKEKRRAYTKPQKSDKPEQKISILKATKDYKAKNNYYALQHISARYNFFQDLGLSDTNFTTESRDIFLDIEKQKNVMTSLDEAKAILKGHTHLGMEVAGLLIFSSLENFLIKTKLAGTPKNKKPKKEKAQSILTDLRWMRSEDLVTKLVFDEINALFKAFRGLNNPNPKSKTKPLSPTELLVQAHELTLSLVTQTKPKTSSIKKKKSMTIEEFKIKLIETPETIGFTETMAVIDSNYKFSPTMFKNGEAVNKVGTNNGSCKLFAFAQLQELDQAQTLACFGDYYRLDVLENPRAKDHANIRNFIVHGWEEVEFFGDALTEKV
jgi:hypothetical protein